MNGVDDDALGPLVGGHDPKFGRGLGADGQRDRHECDQETGEPVRAPVQPGIIEADPVRFRRHPLRRRRDLGFEGFG